MLSPEDRKCIMVVDDSPENIDVLVNVLSPQYRIKVALNGEKALRLCLEKSLPDLILLDIMMPGMDGYEVCRHIKSKTQTAKIPVIFVTARRDDEDEKKGFDLGAIDYITKPVSPAVVRARVKTHLALYDQANHLDSLVRERTRELQETRLKIVQRLGVAAEFKDNETGMHVVRMSMVSQHLGLAAGMSETEAETLLHAAPMHDIGKIGIPDNILLKPGKLSPEEWKIMKTHTTIGARILGDEQREPLRLARTVALTHHEMWDGKGYPTGLAGQEIPLAGRIVAIADVFDALTSERPYKKAWSVDQAVEFMKKEAGSHFDPDLLSLFLNMVPRAIEIRHQFDDEPEEE